MTFTVKSTTAAADIFTATDTTDSVSVSQTATVTFTANGAARLVITGSGTQTAGASQGLTITAKDSSGNTDPSYTGAKNLTFSGAASSANPVTAPTVTDKDGHVVAFGTITPITFIGGEATVSGGNNGAMTLYKAETATISVTDGTHGSSGSDQLSVTVSATSHE